MDERDLEHIEKHMEVSRRDLLKIGAMGGLGLAAAGLGIRAKDATEAFAAWAEKSSAAYPGPLVAAAKHEGHLNVITLPRDWANYGQIMDTYRTRWKIGITDAIPLGSSADELTAIETEGHQNRAPDVVDVSPAKAVEGQHKGLFKAYKVATWKTIPANMKDARGRWYGDYWGVASFISLNSAVKNPPKTWADLLKPEYKNQVCLGGDPTQAGEAFGAVFGAALGNGGSLNNIQPGIDFFGKLKQVGNWNPTTANSVSSLSQGATPIIIRWDYLELAMRDELKKNGQAATVSVPATGRYGSYYCQAISKNAPHPMAARLWEEFLYSDEGQLLFLKGYTHPARYADLAKRNKIPAALAKKLPHASFYKNVKFATVAQITAAQAVLAANWHKTMG